MFDRKDFINWSQAAQNRNVSGQDYHNSLRTQLMNQRQDKTKKIVEEKINGKLNLPQRKASRNRTIRNQITEGIIRKLVTSPTLRTVAVGAGSAGVYKLASQAGKIATPTHVRRSQQMYGGEEAPGIGKSARASFPRVPLGAYGAAIGGAVAAAGAEAWKERRAEKAKKKAERNADHHPENVADHPHREVHDKPAASSGVPRR